MHVRVLPPRLAFPENVVDATAYPSEAVPLLVMTGITVVLTTAGVLGYRRRDIASR